MNKRELSRREWMRSTAAACAAGVLACARASAQEPSSPPNLVFVFSDQQSWDMLGCYGSKDVQSPNLDRLAAEGVRFNNCISNSPVCTPYRSILMTGQHPFYVGGMTNDEQVLPGHGNYLAEVLRDAGYHMGYYGKWHLYGGDRDRAVPPGPCRYGFDDEFLTNNCTLNYSKEGAFFWNDKGEKERYGEWEPYGQARQAMGFVDQHAGKPFALFLSWHPPHNWGIAHAGYAAPEDCLDLYDRDTLTLRPNVEDTPEVRMQYQGHMAMITSIDRAFGWLMDKLEEKGLTENTLVVFTSDHGDMLMSYGWPNNKGRAEHGSCRVPLLMRWPERLKPGTNDSLVGALDLMPTLLGLLGLPVPDTCQGTDCSEAIVAGQDVGIEEQPLFFLPGNWRGIYTRRYTHAYSLLPDKPGTEGYTPLTCNILYDRERDPWETSNLFNDPQHQAVREELHAKTLQWMERYHDDGLLFGVMRRSTVREDDLKDMGTPPAQRRKGWECRLKGRPIDYLPTKTDTGVQTG